SWVTSMMVLVLQFHLPPLWCGGLGRWSSRASCLLGCGRSAIEPSANCLLQVCARRPIVPKRLDVGAAGFDLGLFGLAQLEHPEEHPVVFELRLLHDLLAKRENDPPVILSAAACGEHPVADHTHL